MMPRCVKVTPSSASRCRRKSHEGKPLLMPDFAAVTPSPPSRLLSWPSRGLMRRLSPGAFLLLLLLLLPQACLLRPLLLLLPIACLQLLLLLPVTCRWLLKLLLLLLPQWASRGLFLLPPWASLLLLQLLLLPRARQLLP